jgi:PAS domain S-box-containing protein
MTNSTVLVVEDDKIIARGIAKGLKDLGYTCLGMAATGEEAIRKTIELRPDIILMDIYLGQGMDGIDAAEVIRAQLGSPVVFLTAHSDAATLQRAKLTEPFGYVLKPFEEKDLHAAIEVALYKHGMERRRLENEQWLAATLASIGDAVLATDGHGRVRFMNALAERLTGWTQSDALGGDVREIFRIIEEKTRVPVENPALSALAACAPATVVPGAILIDKTGVEKAVDACAAPIRGVNDRLSGAVLVFRDVTNRRRIEDHLHQAQKMEAIGRLAGGIAHDFNNIMTIILGSSELLLAHGKSVPERNDLVREIQQAGNRAAALTEQIVAFGRRQMLVPCPVNLNRVVWDMEPTVRRLIGESIELVTETAPDLGLVKADPTQIGQVILNLSVNAREAMQKGGRLMVVTSNAELGEETVGRHADVKPGRYAMISVSDTGCGMNHQVLPHLFEPFFTTKGFGQGKGMGLATVYGIVKQSGGHIEVSSKVDQGTTIRVYLPLIECPTPTPDRQMTPAAGNNHETILLVDDEEALRRITRTMLEQLGYTVLEASDGVQAIEIAQKYQETIHLMITDLVMPRLSGREAAERLIALKPGLRVLFMSGYTDDEIVHLGVESAAANYLHKPFDLATLTRKVQKLLAGPVSDLSS